MAIMRMGINLTAYQNGFSNTVSPFLNIMKTTDGWGGDGNVTHTRYVDQSNFNLDANGYPIDFTAKGQALADGNSGFVGNFSGVPELQAFFLTNLNTSFSPPYPSGRYVLLWDGAGNPGTLENDANGTLVFSGTNRRIYDISSPSGNGIFLQTRGTLITDLINVTNLRFIYSPDATNGTGLDGSGNPSITPGQNGTGTHEALHNAGKVLNRMTVMQNASSAQFGQTLGIPYLDRIKPFSPLRFMDWGLTNANAQSAWADRTIPTSFKWTTCPYEVMTAACNETNNDGWFCIPVLADSTYNSNMASLVRNGGADTSGRVWSGLNPNLKVYTEFGNEVWQFATLGLPATQEATNGYVAYPGIKSYHCSFSGYIDNNSTPGTYSGVAGNKMTLTSNTSPGTNDNPGVVNTSSTDSQNRLFWTGVTGINRVLSLVSGTPNTTGAVYQIDTSLAVAPTTITQGQDFAAMLWNSIRLAILYGAVWQSTFGVSRVTRVLAGAGGGVTTTSVLTKHATDFSGNGADYPGFSGNSTNIDAHARAPYFGNPQVISSSATLDQFFAQVSSDIDQTITNYLAIYNEMAGLGLDKIPLYVGYEGGQSYYPIDGSFNYDPAKNPLFSSANRDPRFYTYYKTNYLPRLRDTDNFVLFNHFSDVGRYGDYTNSENGNFGALENIQQVHTPKYDALIDFIQSEILGSTPLVPVRMGKSNSPSIKVGSRVL